MELNQNGTLKLADSLQYAKRHKSLNETERALLIKTFQKITLLAADFTNAKLAKNSLYETEYDSFILYLSQHDKAFKYLSRPGTLCPFASPECIKMCLSNGGRAKMDRNDTVGVTGARLRKTLYMLLFRNEFMSHLEKEVVRLKKKQAKKGRRLALRLNGTSDISWQRLVMKHSDVLFYDYTAVPKRAIVESQLENYHVTFSRKETNDLASLNMLQNGVNVAMAFSETVYDSIGDTMLYQGETFKVIDGSAHDMRFLDETDSKGYIIKLKEIKTKLSKNDTGGFIIRDLSHIDTVNQNNEVA